MLIRSQDRTGIFEATNIIINDRCEIIKVVDSNLSFLLGKFDSYKECADTLQYIYNCINSGHAIIDIKSDKKTKSKPNNDLYHLLPLSVVKKIESFKIYNMDELIAKKDYVYSLKGIGPKTAKIIKDAIKKYEEGEN